MKSAIRELSHTLRLVFFLDLSEGEDHSIDYGVKRIHEMANVVKRLLNDGKLSISVTAALRLSLCRVATLIYPIQLLIPEYTHAYAGTHDSVIYIICTHIIQRSSASLKPYHVISRASKILIITCLLTLLCSLKRSSPLG